MSNADTKEFKIFRDVWNLYIKNKDIDKDWESIVDEVHSIEKKYEHDKLCQDLLIAVITDLNRKEKALA